jgi:phage-related tail protein
MTHESAQDSDNRAKPAYASWRDEIKDHATRYTQRTKELAERIEKAKAEIELLQEERSAINVLLRATEEALGNHLAEGR